MTTPTTGRVPATEAGRRAEAAKLTLSDLYTSDPSRQVRAIEAIDPAAIEAEAVAAERERIAGERQGWVRILARHHRYFHRVAATCEACQGPTGTIKSR